MTQANLESLTKECRRQLAVAACKNLMGKVMYYGAGYLNEKMVTLWANRSDCRLVMPWGTYEGIEGVKRCYLQDFGDRSDPGKLEELKGVLMLYTIDTPVIEVAGDGESAKGIWVSSGCESWRKGEDAPNGLWRWGVYETDFVLEDGQWRILHMTFHPYFMTDYHTSWTKAPAYDYAWFPTSCDGPRPTPVYHYSPEAVLPDEPPIPTPFAHL